MSAAGSALGFGCAPVMGRVGRRESLRAMALAFELGVTHFDVARSYGFGRAEQVLGEFTLGRRDRITITTKFGIPAPALGWRHRLALPAARWAARAVPGVQARLRRRAGQILAAQRFDAAFARASLETSLRELRTDHVDAYLLHEPPLLEAATMDSIAATMDCLVREGKVRRWGFAYRQPEDHAHFAGWRPGIVQAEGNPRTLAGWTALAAEARARFVMRPFAGGLDAELGRRLDDLLARHADADQGAQLRPWLPLALARALAGPGGCVVCAMFQPRHVQANVAAMRGLQKLPAALAAVVHRVLDEHLRAVPGATPHAANCP